MGDRAKRTDERSGDLARIRENQRRSRARRKEYLQELEGRLRQCEQVGVEASAEIQAAARKVVEENKRLRQLLIKHGVADNEIEGSPGAPLSTSTASAGSALESLLGQRRPFVGARGDGKDFGNSPRYMSPGTGQSSSSTMASPVAPPTAAYPPPTSHESSIPSSVSYIPPADYHLRQDPYSYTQYDSMAFPPATVPPPIQTYTEAQQPMDSSSSCRTVADVIRYARPYTGQELEAAMGCEDGRDCHIPNSQAFDLMDRWSDRRD